VFKRRFLIVSFIFFFFLVGSLSAFASCFVENEVSGKSAGQIPGSISCLDNEENPFLSQANHHHKRIYLPKMEKRAANNPQDSFLQVDLSYPTLLRPSSCIFLSLSISIYQLKTAYRI
jgi:hypothetical protein